VTPVLGRSSSSLVVWDVVFGCSVFVVYQVIVNTGDYFGCDEEIVRKFSLSGVTYLWAVF